MRISDWSSDVCSSDLRLRWNWSKSKSASSFARSEATKQSRLRVNRSGLLRFASNDALAVCMAPSQEGAVSSSNATNCEPVDLQITAAFRFEDRKCDGSGKSVSVRVNRGGTASIKKQKT